PAGKNEYRPTTDAAPWTYQFKPNATFTDEADIEAFVKQSIGDNRSPLRGPAFLAHRAKEKTEVEKDQNESEIFDDNEDAELEAEYNKAAQARQAEAQSTATKSDPTISDDEAGDFFSEYR